MNKYPEQRRAGGDNGLSYSDVKQSPQSAIAHYPEDKIVVKRRHGRRTSFKEGITLASKLQAIERNMRAEEVDEVYGD